MRGAAQGRATNPAITSPAASFCSSGTNQAAATQASTTISMSRFLWIGWQRRVGYGRAPRASGAEAPAKGSNAVVFPGRMSLNTHLKNPTDRL